MSLSVRSSLAPITGTVAENEKAYPLRVQALANMARLSYVLLAMGPVCVAAGITILVYLDNVDFPISSGAQIWSGAVMTVMGAVGIITSRTSENLKHDIQFNLKCKIGLFYGFSVSSLSICGLATGYTGTGIGLCVNQVCAKDGSPVVIILLSVSLVFIVGMFVCGICGMVFFFWYRNAFQMYSPGYRAKLMQQQLNGLQNQLNQQQGVTNYGGIQYGGQENGGYTNWNAPPPPTYSEKA
ncbi:uncharacterized protein LOC110448082 [Mizuhopecten yessoensis]|uniref:Uncharacterized protein n=1 Tax=Mizuhopecten yessoensis TaxID=6573 RepID=A0A210QU02_MIZYE|nr:uncharacterized protein LOC110448082 [Mizuhopecten yessoensis]OWF52192.1 hypothetical protein KP79_PYT20091 [Mizuhopecten yessoensis]